MRRLRYFYYTILTIIQFAWIANVFYKIWFKIELQGLFFPF